jgi:phosphonate transport system substrate-binding protein
MDRRSLLKHSALALSTLSVLGTARAQASKINIGVLPTLTARTLATQYEPLQNYLSNKLSTKVAFSSAPDWGSFYRNTMSAHHDIVVVAPHIARLMQLDLGMIPIAAYSPIEKGVLVTAKNYVPTFGKHAFGNRIALANPASLLAFKAEDWLNHQGMHIGINCEFIRSKGANSIGPMLLHGDASAGVLCVNEFHSHPAAVKAQLKIHHQVAEFPNFVFLSTPRFLETSGRNIAKYLAEFSDSSTEGKEFEDRTGLKVTRQIPDKDMAAMDTYLDKTKRLLV